MDDKIPIKEEPLHYKEISTELKEPTVHLTHFETFPRKSELIICDIKQESWHLNQTTDINSAVKQPPNSDLRPCMYTVLIKTEDGIKEEPLWHDASTCVNGISTDGPQNEEKESNAGKNDASEEMLSLESARLSTEGFYLEGSNVTFLEAEKNDANSEKGTSQGNSTRPDMCLVNCNPTCNNDQFDSEQNPGVESDQLYRCEICDKCYTRKSSLKMHRTLHLGTTPYKCDKCHKCFTRKSHLQSHILHHSGIKPYKCANCKKSFTQKSDLQRHKLLHSGTKPYKCDACEKCYTQKSDLQRHILLHSNSKPHKCGMCEKCFSQKSHLQRHTLLHTGTKPYKCGTCGKCFTDASSLKRHMLLHSDTKPYKCEHCEKCFTQKSHLQRHTLRHA